LFCLWDGKVIVLLRLEDINRFLLGMVVAILNAALGIVGEYFGYMVLDKIGIVFVASLCDLFTTMLVAVLTPAILTVIFRDPLIAWKIPFYIMYALFLYTAIGSVRGKFKKPGVYQLMLAILFIVTGATLLVSGYFIFIFVGISVLGFGLLLFITYLVPFMFKYRFPIRLVGIISILLAPFFLVMMDLAVYSTMIYNIFSPDWIGIIRTTVLLLAIDSAGPLVLLGIIWLALDIPTLLRETHGKISQRRRAMGLLLLLLILFPVPVYVATRTANIESQIRSNITMALPDDWAVHTARMSYIWSPLGATGVVFVAFPPESYMDEGSEWYRGGINFYVIRGKDILKPDGSVDEVMLKSLIILQFVAWYRSQKEPLRSIVIKSLNITGKETLGNTSYTKVCMLMDIYMGEEKISIQLICYITRIRELSNTGAIICYTKKENFEKLKDYFPEELQDFKWL